MPARPMQRYSTMVARNAYKAKVAKQPPKPKLRKPSKPWARKNTVLKHIPGTFGILSRLADRLGCSYGTVVKWLNTPGWEHVKEAMENEKLAGLERMKSNVFSIAQFSIDDSTRLNASKFLLERLDPDFNPKNTTVVEGGDKAIQHDHHVSGAVVMVPADVLDMPLSDQVKILEAGEARQKELIKEVEAEVVA